MNLAEENILNYFLVILVVRNIFIKFCNLIRKEQFKKIENVRINSVDEIKWLINWIKKQH